MKTLKPFAAIAAIIAGIVLIALTFNGFFWDSVVEAFVGVILLAAGVTYFWMRSRFYRE